MSWAGLAPVAFVLLWSTGFVGARYGLPYAAPFTFLALRLGLYRPRYGTLFAGADVALSVSMTALSTIAAVVLMPLMLYIYASGFASGANCCGC